MAFCHLHKHSEFSPLDGTGTANQYTRQAVKFGQEYINLTDHGRLGGILDHVYACRHPEKLDDPDDESQKRSSDETLIPLLGIEAFYRPDRFMELKKGDEFGKNPHNWAQHLTITAGSLRGWKTLMRLSSKAWVRRELGGGYYGKPCVDMAMIEEDHEDIFISTGCMASPLSQFILRGDERGARQWIENIREHVGDNLWFEIMPHDFEEQRQINLEKINLADEYGHGIVATGDVHTPYEEWSDTHEVVRMASYKTTVSKQEQKKEAGEDVYTERIETVFLSHEEHMHMWFENFHPDIPDDRIDEAVNNTVEFAKAAKFFQIGKGVKLPKVSSSAQDASRTIKLWCKEGMKRIGKAGDPIYEERLRYEFGVLRQKGVLDYFILVGDLVRWAKSDRSLPGDDRRKRPIRVGLGRGSAAGCLVSYLIGITAIDPIAWGLLFERFLNPDRVGMPDIDLDFETELPIMEVDGKQLDGREMCKEYLARKYGHDHVADIIAYQTFAPRVTIKEVGATQEIPYLELDKVTESIGDTERGLEKIAKNNPTVAKFKDKHPNVWMHCLRIEDQILRDTKHAGGVLITPKPVNFYMPTQLGNDEVSVVTAWADRAEFPIISDYGFIKIDVLGVKSLAKQQLCVDLIREHYGVEFEPNDLPCLRDPYDIEPAVLDGFVKGMTIGVFQFSGRGITQLLRHIKPDNAMDISVANALFRPGPIKIAFEYGDRKNGKTPVSYWHDALEPVLSETLGLMCFQEQAMEVVKQIGNFTGGQADAMRKAMSKLYRLPGDKAQEFMQQYKDIWMQGCHANGLREQEAEDIWTSKMLPLGNYLFNKSHSSSYGLQACQDMHMKIFFPLAFYASVLTIEKKSKASDDAEWKRNLFREAKVLDVDVNPPDINLSQRGFSIVGDQILYGLVGVKEIGGKNVPEIIDARPFEDYRDFVVKIPSSMGADACASLVKAGAFDRIDEREALLTRCKKWKRPKFTVILKCGCKKTRTGERDEWKPVECEKHDEDEIVEIKEIEPYYTIAEHLKTFLAKEKEPPEPEDVQEPSFNEILEMEKEALGNVVSRDAPIHRFDDFIAKRIFTEPELAEVPKRVNAHKPWCDCEVCAGSEVVVGGEITGLKVIKTKKQQKEMAFLDLAYGANQYNVTIFNKLWLEVRETIRTGQAFLVKGRKDKDDGGIVAELIDDVEEIARDFERTTKATALKKRVRKKAKMNPFERKAMRAGRH